MAQHTESETSKETYMNQDCGIYMLKNIITGDFYIGQSIHMAHRKGCHLYELRSHRHANKHLQRAFNKYGEENFVFEVLQCCEESRLTEYEQAFVNIWKPRYNMCKECVRGMRHSDETKRKISMALTGKKLPKEQCRKISEANMGKHSLSEDHLAKLVAINTGKIVSDATKQKMHDVNTGKKLSEDHKRKIGLASKAYWTQRKAKASS